MRSILLRLTFQDGVSVYTMQHNLVVRFRDKHHGLVLHSHGDRTSASWVKVQGVLDPPAAPYIILLSAAFLNDVRCRPAAF